uniref:Uncharacterized protein n=1 Tax=Anguilla anguilla TaxID=7936 RepID=A0A0E9UMY5_ANGAN
MCGKWQNISLRIPCQTSLWTLACETIR